MTRLFPHIISIIRGLIQAKKKTIFLISQSTPEMNPENEKRVLDRHTSEKAPVVRIETWKICRVGRSRGGPVIASIGEGMVSGEGEGGRSRRSLRKRKKPPPCYSQHLRSNEWWNGLRRSGRDGQISLPFKFGRSVKGNDSLVLFYEYIIFVLIIFLDTVKINSKDIIRFDGYTFLVSCEWAISKPLDLFSGSSS